MNKVSRCTHCGTPWRLEGGIPDFVGDKYPTTMHAHSLGNDALEILRELRKRGWRLDRKCFDAEWRSRAGRLLNEESELRAKEDIESGGDVA